MEKNSKVTFNDSSNYRVSAKINTDQYSKMTFKELKNELFKLEQDNSNNNNNEKIKIIRKIMYQRYQNHMSKKKYPNNTLTPIYKKSNKNYVQDTRVQELNSLDFLDDDGSYKEVKDCQNVGFSRENYSRIATSSKFNFKKGCTEGYDRDQLNDNLTDRLNSDLDIYNIKSKKNTKGMVFVPPFSNDPGSNYALIDKQESVKNFSNNC